MRRYVLARLAVAALLLVATLGLGCEPSIPEGRFACDADEDCPPGLVCRPERNRCYETLVATDAG